MGPWRLRGKWTEECPLSSPSIHCVFAIQLTKGERRTSPPSRRPSDVLALPNAYLTRFRSPPARVSGKPTCVAGRLCRRCPATWA